MKLFIEIILLATFISEFLLGMFIYFKGKHMQANRYFCLMMIAGSFWSFFLAVAIILSNSTFDRLDVVFGLFGNAFFVLFSQAFSKSEEKISIKFLLGVIVTPIILSPIILFSKIIISKTTFYPNGLISSTDGPLGMIFYLYHLFYWVLGFYLLVRGYKSATGLRKIHFQYLLLGFGLILGIFIIINLILPIFGIYYLITLSSSLFLILAFFFLYIITRYRFMDIRVVLRKGFVHGVSLIILLAIYTYLTLSFQDYFALNRTYTTLIAMLVIALTIYPLRKWLFRNIDALLFEPEKEKEVFEKFSTEITSGFTVEDLLKRASEAIFQGLGVKAVKIFILDKSQEKFSAVYPENMKGHDFLEREGGIIKYLSEKKDAVVREEIPYLIEGTEEKESEELKALEKELNKNQAEIAVPLGEENIFGLIFLGAKKSSEAYTVQDIRFLNNFARYFTMYLGNTLLYWQTLERIERKGEEV